MEIHELKILPEHFEAIKDGSKTFEVRRNDRNFKVRDKLLLCEYNKQREELTGKAIIVEVTYILDDEAYCKEGYVILGIKKEK